MLADTSMDRKTSAKSSTGSVKPSISNQDPKLQETVNKASRNGSGRKREPNNTSLGGPRRDNGRKLLPQKNKFVDKRPAPRGNLKSSRIHGEVTLGSEPEVGSVIRQGSKKQNVEQLINFHHEPRAGTLYSANNWRVPSTGPRCSHNYYHRYPKYNKEQFLQANYQFVVRSDEKYSTKVCDADLLVDWTLVEEIHLATNQVPSCPICLYTPRAAKITRCGHIYCWPCLLHYLALSDKNWRKCPICYEAVHLSDLKSVVANPRKEYEVGTKITMQLMKRERDSTIALPMTECSTTATDQPLSVTDKSTRTNFTKLLVATPKDVAAVILSRERAELERKLHEDKDEPEAIFIEQALQLLAEREKTILPTAVLPAMEEALTPEIEVASSVITKDGFEAVEYVDAFEEKSAPTITDGPIGLPQRERYESVGAESAGTEGEGEAEELVTAEDLNISAIETPKETASSANKKQPKNTFYFYQAIDGQQIYLHALNVHMLVEEYGSLEKCPPSLTSKVLERSSVTMTKELRHRWRYLQHLPLCSQLQMVELDIRPPLVNPHTWAIFQEQVKSRRRTRQRKAKADQKRDQLVSSASYGLQSNHHFPQVGSQHCPIPKLAPAVQGVEDGEADLLTSPGLDNTDSTSTAASSLSSDGKGMSFAQMLRDGQMKAGSSGKGAWGGMKKSGTFPVPPLSVADHEAGKGSDDEEYSPPPGYKQSFCDDICTLIPAQLHQVSDNVEMGSKSSSKSSKKKKGKQKHLLFSNSMTFSG